MLGAGVSPFGSFCIALWPFAYILDCYKLMLSFQDNDQA